MSVSQNTSYAAPDLQSAQEQNKELVRRLIEDGFSKGGLSVVDELVAPDCQEHQFFPPGHPRGRDGVKAIISDLHRLFADFSMTIEEMVAEGDKVWLRATGSGTHQAEFFGAPPTGKHITVPVIDIFRFENGQMVEHWGVSDRFHLMAQLGLLPHPPRV